MDRELLRTYDDVVTRHEELGRSMADPKVLGDAREMKRIGREQQRLGKLRAAMEAYQRALDELGEAHDILGQTGDPDLVALAKAELPALEAGEEARRDQLKKLLVPPDPNDDRSALVEIRAGTGGEEATLFAGDLFRLYIKFAERKGYRVDILYASRTELGGMKEGILLIEGEGAYGALRFEGGVHRVQRVPATEASGRIHTSAASVAVLPEAEEVDVEIRPDELKIDVFRSSGPGGQSVNTTDSAVRLTHLPTGIVVQCQDERSQLKNKAKAMKVLYAKLLDMRRQEQDAEVTAARRSMVSTGDRSAKIRTYNFPQNRLTDHRINYTSHGLDRFLEGDIDELVQALRMADTEDKLRADIAG